MCIRDSLTVITNSLESFIELKDQPEIKSILIGGEYNKEESAFYGDLAVESIKKLHVSKFFLFPSAVSINFGITDYVRCV